MDGEISPTDHDYICTAKCYPACQYRWVDVRTGRLVHEGQKIKIDDDSVTDLRCIAENSLGIVNVSVAVTYKTLVDSVDTGNHHR